MPAMVLARTSFLRLTPSPIGGERGVFRADPASPLSWPFLHVLVRLICPSQPLQGFTGEDLSQQPWMSGTGGGGQHGQGWPGKLGTGTRAHAFQGRLVCCPFHVLRVQHKAGHRVFADLTSAVQHPCAGEGEGSSLIGVSVAIGCAL